MKNIFLTVISMCLLFSCTQTPSQSTAATTPVLSPDSAAVAEVIHGFYKWYDTFVNSDAKKLNFVNYKAGKHLILDAAKVNAYFEYFQKSGFVSAAYIEGEKTYFKECEAIWQQEEYEDGVPTGMDADKVFCAQDWVLDFWTKSPVHLKPLSENKVAATMYGIESGSPKEHNFELQKENGKWLISKIECDTGLPQNWIVVDNKYGILLFGKTTTLENLQKGLLDSLSKMTVIPDEIPIRFDEEVLMGMRGEVRTECYEALEKAKKGGRK